MESMCKMHGTFLEFPLSSSARLPQDEIKQSNTRTQNKNRLFHVGPCLWNEPLHQDDKRQSNSSEDCHQESLLYFTLANNT